MTDNPHLSDNYKNVLRIVELEKALAEATRLLERTNNLLSNGVKLGPISRNLLSNIQDWLRIARVPS